MTRKSDVACSMNNFGVFVGDMFRMSPTVKLHGVFRADLLVALYVRYAGLSDIYQDTSAGNGGGQTY